MDIVRDDGEKERLVCSMFHGTHLFIEVNFGPTVLWKKDNVANVNTWCGVATIFMPEPRSNCNHGGLVWSLLRRGREQDSTGRGLVRACVRGNVLENRIRKRGKEVQTNMASVAIFCTGVLEHAHSTCACRLEMGGDRRR